MRKALLIMAAALMTMTQCRKQETMPMTPSANTIKMTVTAGSGAKTDISTETGAITWSAGDKLYVSDGTNWLGSLTLVGEGGSAQGTFTGDIAGLDESETSYHFFYLGHDNGMTEPTGTAAVNISFARQDGTLAGAMKYHIGCGNTNVTVHGGEYAGYVEMDTKIAIAHINFTTDGTSAYTGYLTMGGTGIFNILSVNPNGIDFSGSGATGITINNGGGYTTGERYVTLIPTTGTDRVDVSFTGDATGSMTFLAGIRENKFYGMKDALAVTVEAAAPAAVFSVSPTTTVEFAPGNLYWDGSVFRFEENQWSTTPTSEGTWDESHVSHFKWSDAANAVTSDYSYSGDLFCNNNFTVTGDSHTWRTLTNDEWEYLLHGRINSSHAWVTLTDVSVSGLVILPDGSSVTAASGITTSSALAGSGAVFLPAAGYRYGTYVFTDGSRGYYWSSGLIGDYEEPGHEEPGHLDFDSRGESTTGSSRRSGEAVRLVR